MINLLKRTSKIRKTIVKEKGKIFFKYLKKKIYQKSV